MKKLLSALILSSVIACSSVEYIPQRLELPPKTAVPVLTNKEIACVRQETYNTLVHRDLAYNFYIARLEAVIKSTWNGEDDTR